MRLEVKVVEVPSFQALAFIAITIIALIIIVGFINAANRKD